MARKILAENTDIKEMIDALVENAQSALEAYMKMTEEQIDRIVHEMALAGLNEHTRLAKLAVEETGRGVYEDKVIKNMFATEYIWNSIKHEKTVGIVEENELEGYSLVAEPVGVVAGVTPVTNPTSTTMFKSLICVKTRNPIIFGFHPSAQRCSVESARVVYEAALKAGAPRHCIQWIDKPSIEATTALMNHAGVSLILATGGSSMVRTAYSCGKPALGVGPGNVPCYIEKTANLERACTDLIMSKTFDNGMICASEQAVIVDREIAKPFEKYMSENGCIFLKGDQIEQLRDYVFAKGKLNAAVVGKPAGWIAAKAGIEVPEKAKILIVPLKAVDETDSLCGEKLSPILAYYQADSTEQGFDFAAKTLDLGGLGHTAVIHSGNETIIEAYSKKMRVGRVIANSPASQGAIGDIYNTNTPSLTLGCGSYGHNSTTANVSSVNLINKKRLAHRRVNMQWFKIPPKIYFEEGAVQYLAKMRNISRAFIVTDQTMVKLGYVDKVLYYLRKRETYCHSEIYADVEPDPDVETILRGMRSMREFEPDVIIALGGGSAIDAAKGMWLFYEHPDATFDGLKLKFLDIRKRAYSLPKLGEKAQFVAIPTTSGTGSEVTSFSVITDAKHGNIKYPLADYSLTPDVAIIDPQFVESMPQSVVADTGLDALTHAIEAYVSVMASDYTDGLALQAVDLIFDNLYASWKGDRTAREKMHNASCIAGMAFTNAFLGLNHSMAHKLGGEFHIPHGRANAILLPYVIRFNAQTPTKFTTFPKYDHYIAPEKYAKIAKVLGFGAKNTEIAVHNLIEEIRSLTAKLGVPASIAACGVQESEFQSKLEALSYHAHADQCTTANPRYPLVEEIKALYIQAYQGEFPVKSTSESSI